MPDTPALDPRPIIDRMDNGRVVVYDAEAVWDMLLSLHARVADLQADNARLREAKEAEWDAKCREVHRADLAKIRELYDRLGVSKESQERNAAIDAADEDD